MLRKSVVILAMLLSSLATQVFALGLGTVTVESALNQPLRVRIEILQLGDTRLQDISVQMASLADFQRFNIDRIGFLSNVRFSIASSPDGNFVTLTTNQAVREPYLSLILDTRWPGGRLLSEHTILLDLPVFDAQQPVSTVRQPISPVLQPPTSSTQPGVNAAVTPEPAAPVTAPTPSVPTTATAAPEDPAPVEPVAVDPEPIASEPELQPEPAPVLEQQDEPVTAEPAAPAPTEEVTEPEDAAAAAETAAEAANAEPATIETIATDTLSDIALQVRPDSSVSMQQTMLAIQRLNPDAFIDGNINRMRSGQVLRVPDLAAVQSVDAREAATEINRQNQEFADTDVQPLAAPSNQAANQDATPQGQLSVVTNANAIDASSGAGQLDSAENAELDQRIAELESALEVQQEEADRARIEREELDARMDELEQQIAAAQEIIRLQDIQLAQLQDSLARAAEEQAAIAAAEAQVAEQTESRTSLPGDIMRIITGNILFVGFVLVLVILLLVFLLLRRNRARIDDSDLNALDEENYVTRKTAVDDLEAKEFEDYAEGDLDDELDQIIGVDTVNDPLSQARALMAKGNTNQAIALLQEALEQSPNDQELRVLLLEAFAQQGDLAAFEEQADIIGDDPEFISKINNLRRNIKAKAAIVGREGTKPKPPLFGRKPTTDDEDHLGAASFLDDLGIDLDAFDDDDDDPSVTERSVKPETNEAGKRAIENQATQKPGVEKPGIEKTAAEKTSAEWKSATPSPAPVPSLDDDSFHPDDMDLTFDLVGDGGDATPAAKTPDVTTGPGPAAALEFDLDDEPVANEDSAGEEAKPDLEMVEFSVDDEPAEPIAKAPATADENLLDFDFDKSEIQPAKTDAVVDDLETFEFDIDENPAATVVEKTELSQAEDSDTLDIDIDEFNLDDDSLNVAASADATTTIESRDDSDVDMDLDFDFDDDSADDSAPAASAAKVEDEEDEPDDLDFLSDDDIEIESVDDVTGLSDADEVATKLELAYAYRKMGDDEGASEILQEVLMEGTPDQVKEATELMSSIRNK